MIKYPTIPQLYEKFKNPVERVLDLFKLQIVFLTLVCLVQLCRMLHDPKMFFTDDSDVDNTHTSIVGPSYDVTASTPVYLPTTYITRPYTQSRRSSNSQLVENEDAIQEYGRVIKKRGRRQGSNTGFLYEPHLFGHDVLFPAPIHSSPFVRKPSHADNRETTTAASTGVSGPELVLPGKFRIMK